MNEQTKNLLKAVRLAEKNAEHSEKWRPDFHLFPPCGWMNDPNGLFEKNGTKHIFFQYSPFDTKPGLNFWGHFSTEDYINYKYYPPALCSDERFDCHGVYSGSALTEDDIVTLFYTGNVKEKGNFDYISEGREHNTVAVTTKDGIIMGDKRLLLTNNDYPTDDTCHVRDPKVWKENGFYYMVLGARRRDDVGEVLLYKSDNKTDWKLQNRISGNLGYMWECPDMYVFGNKRFLSISPQGVKAEKYRFNNVYQSGYMEIKDFEKDYVLGDFYEYDCGFDFYAPQTFKDDSDRRVLIAWMGLPDIDYQNPTDKLGWVHALTMPREIFEKNGKIFQKPLSEIEKIRYNESKYNCEAKITIPDKTVFECIISPKDSSMFSCTIRKDVNITFKNKIFTLSMGASGYGRTKREAEIERVENIRIFCDKSSIEIFINDGEYVFTTRFYPEDSNTGIIINSETEAMTIWDLKSFEYKVV